MNSSAPLHQAERSMLGAVLLSNDALGRIADIITPEGLNDPKHRLVMAAMLKVEAAGDRIDAISLAAALEATGDINAAGGLAYLCELTQASATSVNVEAHARVAAEAYKRRRLRAAAEAIARHAADTSQTVSEALSASDGLLAALLDAPGRGEVVQTQRESSLALWTRLQAVAEGNEPPRVPYGLNLERLTEMTGGGADISCEMVAIAARSGVGKTNIADQLADEIGRLGLGSVLYFTDEVSGDKLEQRRMARRIKVNAQRIGQWRLSDGEIDRLVHEGKRIKSETDGPGVKTFQKVGFGVDYIGRKVRQECRRGKVAAIFVDYWQLCKLNDGKRYHSRTDELFEIAGRLKAIQMENQVPMFVMAQLNRGPANSPNGRPDVDHIRGGAGLEFYSSVILLLHRPAYKNSELVNDDGTEAATLIMCKQREGPVGDIRLTHHAETGRFWIEGDPWMHNIQDVERLREQRSRQRY